MARDDEGIAGLLIGGAALTVAIYGIAKYDRRNTLQLLKTKGGAKAPTKTKGYVNI